MAIFCALRLLREALSGTAAVLREELTGIFLHGGISIVLINLAGFLNDWLILPKFDDEQEIIRDRNAGTASSWRPTTSPPA